MEIKIKYKVKDLVWFYHNGKATEATIYKIDIEVYAEKTTIRYMVDIGIMGSAKFETAKEELCFLTKQELIDSL